MEEQALMASAQENEIFILSADNISNLTAKCRELADTVEGISYAELTDLAAGLGNEADSRHKLRAAFIAGNPDELVDKLHKLKSILETSALDPGQLYQDESERIWLGNPADRPRVGFLFPGQGSQKLNMARILGGAFSMGARTGATGRPAIGRIRRRPAQSNHVSTHRSGPGRRTDRFLVS